MASADDRRNSLLASIDKHLAELAKHAKTLADNSKRGVRVTNYLGEPPDPFSVEAHEAAISEEKGKDEEPPKPSPFPQSTHPYFKRSEPDAGTS